jgi:hypothetical protein
MERLLNITNHYQEVSDDPTAVACWKSVKGLTNMSKAKPLEVKRSQQAVLYLKQQTDEYNRLMAIKTVSSAVATAMKPQKAAAAYTEVKSRRGKAKNATEPPDESLESATERQITAALYIRRNIIDFQPAVRVIREAVYQLLRNQFCEEFQEAIEESTVNDVHIHEE